jgi:uncharacterized protein (DUF4415 family)
MNGKSQNTPTEWADPDDAPELTAEFFNRATPMIGGREVSIEEFTRVARKMVPMGRPKSANPKVSVTIRYDADIVAAFKAGGEGWQTRMNDALRDWMKNRRPD